MKHTLRILIAAFFAATLFAANATAATPDEVSGTWTWTAKGPHGRSFEQKLTLNIKDGAVTGTMDSGTAAEAPIANAIIKNDTITFDVIRQRGGNKFTTTYTGKIKGDTITGSYKMVGTRGGGSSSIDWDATRAKTS